MRVLRTEGHTITLERRSDDRRGRNAFRLTERRTGFDRRRMTAEGLLGAWDRLIHTYRGADLALIGVLVGANILNVLDFAMTVRALGAGATEANPILAELFAWNVWGAGAFKLSAVLGVSGLVWLMRRYRRILEVSIVMLLIFSAVAAYQFAGALWLL